MEKLKRNLNDSKYLKWLILLLVGFVNESERKRSVQGGR